MEWAVETVLPRKVQKLASAIEEKDAALAHQGDQIEALEFMNEEEHQANQQEILRSHSKQAIWRWLTNVMIQTSFTDGVDLSTK